ncbi:Cys/Met metabolism PLP-dependent enzyme-domain-containing protein [Haematococcus lacustris]
MDRPANSWEDRLARDRVFGEHGGVNPSIEVSTTFTVMAADLLPAIFAGSKGPAEDQGGCYLYGRAHNPTVRALSNQLAALEALESAYCTSSGMAAISCALLALCNAGDHVVSSNTVYGGTHALLKTFLPLKCGITTTFVDITDLEAVKAALTPKTKVLFCESLSNPTLVVADLPALAHLAHEAGAQLMVDNTFTPCLVTPAQWGADVVVHSLTKFVSGASDIIAGAVCGSQALVNSLINLHAGPVMLLGPTMDPRIAAELSLRLPHLGLRMQEHSRRALALATGLSGLGACVTYPGLPTHPQHKLLCRLANPGYGLGGLVGVDLGSKAQADAFMERLQNMHGFGYMAVSLGYFDTLMSASAASTSSELSSAELASSGISAGYVRMSIGITGSLEQRWLQLKEAYLHAAAQPAQQSDSNTPAPSALLLQLQPGQQTPATCSTAAAAAAASCCSSEEGERQAGGAAGAGELHGGPGLCGSKRRAGDLDE